MFQIKEEKISLLKVPLRRTFLMLLSILQQEHFFHIESQPAKLSILMQNQTTLQIHKLTPKYDQ